MNKQPNTLSAEKLAWVLSIGGFLPMAVLAAVLLLLTDAHGLFSPFVEIFKAWSALILSFMGGIRWGMALNEDPVRPWTLLFSIFPCAVGWATLLMPEPVSIMVLLLAYCALGAWDSFAINSGAAPLWFGRLRIWLTFLVATAHIAVTAAVY